MSLWTGQLSIGNRILDSEHKKLHSMIGRIAGSVAARDVAALSGSFDLLEGYLCTYFLIEENIAQAVNFDFTHHRLAHQYLLKEIQRIRIELMSHNGAYPDDENYARSLMNCLIWHIKEDSRPLKIVLDTCFYNLKP